MRDERAELMQITVSEPTEMPNGRTYYRVIGFDRTGRFETKRRYNDFHALFTTLRERLPGLYIPSLPPKKFIGNTKSEFLDERSFHLEQFLKKVYKLPYLLESEELEIFGRERNVMVNNQQADNWQDVGDKLNNMEKQNTALLAYRVKQVAPQGEKQATPKDLMVMHRELLDCKAFCIRHKRFLEGLRDLLKTFTENAESLVLGSEH